jgi:hypothetical protein
MHKTTSLHLQYIRFITRWKKTNSQSLKGIHMKKSFFFSFLAGSFLSCAVFAQDITNTLGSSGNFLIKSSTGTELMRVIDSTGRVGIGTNSPASTWSVGSTSQFQVNSSGNIVKINNVATNFPSSQGGAGALLKNDGSGNLSWSSSTHYIGESYGGGIVFYVYDNGQHGLIAAAGDQSSGAGMRWNGGSFSFTITRARADGIGAGKANTALIIANQASIDSAAFAATLCNEYSVTDNGVTYGDWYLPSKYELNLLCQQQEVVGGFATNGYWSSTEANNLEANYQYFLNGIQMINGKSSTLHVRAIRAF